MGPRCFVTLAGPPVTTGRERRSRQPFHPGRDAEVSSSRARGPLPRLLLESHGDVSGPGSAAAEVGRCRFPKYRKPPDHLAAVQTGEGGGRRPREGGGEFPKLSPR